MKKINFEIIKKFGVRFDMRAWSADYKSVGKGISITFPQALELLNLLNNMEQCNESDQNQTIQI